MRRSNHSAARTICLFRKRYSFKVWPHCSCFFLNLEGYFLLFFLRQLMGLFLLLAFWCMKVLELLFHYALVCLVLTPSRDREFQLCAPRALRHRHVPITLPRLWYQSYWCTRNTCDCDQISCDRRKNVFSS